MIGGILSLGEFMEYTIEELDEKLNRLINILCQEENVDVNKFKPEIQKIAQEQANLSVDFENAKILTTPLLGAGLKMDNLVIKLPDGSLLFSADSLKTRVALPSLFVLTAKVSCLEVNNPLVNLEIINDEQFKVIQLVEDILNKGKEQKLEQANVEEEQKSWFNPAWIRIKVSNVVLNNYKVLVKDLKSGHYLNLKGEELRLGYFNGKRVKLKTYAELFSDENKNVTANVNINTFLPPPAPLPVWPRRPAGESLRPDCRKCRSRCWSQCCHPAAQNQIRRTARRASRADPF